MSITIAFRLGGSGSNRLTPPQMPVPLMRLPGSSWTDVQFVYNSALDLYAVSAHLVLCCSFTGGEKKEESS